MIEVSRLTKVFKPAKGLLGIFGKRENVTALGGVDLKVEKGEVFVLLGPNGAGKTTLIKILCSIILPDGGDVKIGGYDIKTQKRLAKRQIGLVVGDERSFYWRLTGRQNLKFFATLFNLRPRDAHKKINDISQLLDLRDIDRRYQECSTGMKQRLAIARCLLSDARVIFMDELTKSLDPLAARDLKKFIRDRLAKDAGKTVFFTTHLTHEAEELADKIAVIDRGTIKVQGSLKDLRSKIGNAGAGVEEIYRWSLSL